MTAPGPITEHAPTCPHTVTKGREGHRAGDSWCVDCGAHVLTVHDQPCGECVHIFNSVGYVGCRRHLMAVTPSMLVTYKIGRSASDGGLCFEEPRQ